MDHPAVLSAALVGVPDARATEIGAAFVQLRPQAECSGEELREHCRRRLVGYKVPRHISFVDAFPVSSSGKIQKLVLRDRFLDQQPGST